MDVGVGVALVPEVGLDIVVGTLVVSIVGSRVWVPGVAVTPASVGIFVGWPGSPGVTPVVVDDGMICPMAGGVCSSTGVSDERASPNARSSKISGEIGAICILSSKL